MRKRQVIKQVSTIFLILVLSQKMGAGLYIHNWLHAPHSKQAASSPASPKDVRYACNCLNDFYIPFTETEQPVIWFPVFTTYYEPAAPACAIPSVYKYFHSLRAPPKESA